MRNDFEHDTAEQQGPRAGGKVRPGFIVGFVLACVLTAGITWAATRGESSTLATPVNAYGNAGVPLAQHSAAGELECYVTNQPSATTQTVPGYQVCEYQVANGGAQPVSATNPLPVAEQVPTTSTLSCLEVIANTAGDGGTLTPTFGTLYELIVEAGNGNVRMANGVGCTAYAGGTGQIENDGVDKYFRPKLTPDGGVPTYYVCAASGTVRVMMCPMQ
jgi:hypothetical protein